MIGHNRREFLGAVACAFAVAAVPCSIPAMAREPEAPAAPGRWIWVGTHNTKWFLSGAGKVFMPQLERFALPPGYVREFYMGDAVGVGADGYVRHAESFADHFIGAFMGYV